MTVQNYPFGYCTNVHAGTTLEQAQSNLVKYAQKVRATVAPNGILPVGIWLAEDAAQRLSSPGAAEGFANWLQEHCFLPYTLNGFPQGDFHQPVVKHAVYHPEWREPSRAEYTKSLARILSAILPDGQTGSISTLPLGWPYQPWQDGDFRRAAEHLLDVARQLATLAQTSGKEIVLAIEPEPGCVITTSADLIRFFEKYLFTSDDAEIARRHLAVCHDMCHSSVMFEPQETALQAYLEAGIRIGKSQVSSAVHVPWDKCRADALRQQDLRDQLTTFDEPRYLHQTTRCDEHARLVELCEDLEIAVQQWGQSTDRMQHPWRIHFHVPIFIGKFANLETTQHEIRDATRFLQAHGSQQIAGAKWFTGHFEVETYAWTVLPDSLAVEDLAQGISRELQYFESIIGG
jgi:hypothetical protein